MTPKEINDLKKEHNRLLVEGKEAYAKVMDLQEKCISLQRQIKEAEGDDYDPIPLIFGEGFWINQNL